MIRINLLPVKKDRRKEAARNQFAVAALAIGVEIGVCFFINMLAIGVVEEQRNANQIESANVESLKKQVADHATILKEITEFEKRQSAIEGLQSARTGPVFVLVELSNFLSAGGRPYIAHDKYQEMIRIDPAAGYDENWDYRRLWINSFVEENRRLTVKGQATTHEDVAEFLRRLHLSEFFVSTQLVSTALAAPTVQMKGFDLKNTDPVVHFVVSGEIRYR